MFAVTCPTFDARVLIFPPSIHHLTNTPDGIVVTFSCACGVSADMLSGRRAATPGALIRHGGVPARDLQMV